jgi:hypothetical protein
MITHEEVIEEQAAMDHIEPNRVSIIKTKCIVH